MMRFFESMSIDRQYDLVSSVSRTYIINHNKDTDSVK